MELSWVNKLRIALVAAVGIVVIGILAWPLVAPEDPLAPIRASNISPSGTMGLLVLALAVGFAGYFVAWPHGREIGILAVPFGLTVWAGRSGPMQTLTQAFEEPYEREALLHSLRFEPIYWLLVVTAGFVGVLIAQRLRPGPKPALSIAQIKDYLKPAFYLNVAIALAGATVLAQFFVGAFGRDVTTGQRHVATQPAVGQIIFAVIAAFAVTAFVIKKFLDLGYIWPAITSAFIILFAQAAYYNAGTLQKFAETYPATFYPKAVFAILPLQFVALGTLGSVIGYWLAVRYDYWRKHETA